MIQPQTLQQILVRSGFMLCSFCDGFIFGHMSGMLVTLKSKDSDIVIDDDDFSWIASILNITCFIGIGLGTLLSEKIGRRRSITILTAPMLLSWIILYYAKNVMTIILTRILIGTCFGGVITLLYILTCEYTSTNVRGLYMNIICSVVPAIGTASGHVLSIVFHWRTVALIALAPTLIAVILTLFWVESPSWLASKGRFEECQVAFWSLHKRSDASERELNLLVDLETSRRKTIPDSNLLKLKNLKSMLSKTYFWKIVLIDCTVIVYRTAGGKVLFSTFAITILEEITSSHDILLFTLVVDALVVLGTIMSCVLIRTMKLRTQLFPTAILANILLVALSATLYLKFNSAYFSWINTTLIGLYFIAIYSGPIPVVECIGVEIIPLEIKNGFIALLGTISAVVTFLSIKLAPSMFITLGYHGVFFLNAMIMTGCLIYFWIVLPETKGKTLQEIELFIKTNTYEIEDELLSKEQRKELI